MLNGNGVGFATGSTNPSAGGIIEANAITQFTNLVSPGAGLAPLEFRVILVSLLVLSKLILILPQLLALLSIQQITGKHEFLQEHRLRFQLLLRLVSPTQGLILRSIFVT